MSTAARVTLSLAGPAALTIRGIASNAKRPDRNLVGRSAMSATSGTRKLTANPLGAYGKGGMMIPWTKVAMCEAEGRRDGEPAAIPEGHDPERIKALREYRNTSEMNRVWLCTPEQMETEDDCTWLGPTVDEIDWSGFPAKE